MTVVETPDLTAIKSTQQQTWASGNFSVAIGKNARTANRQGSIVLGDGCAGFSSDSVYPTANNQVVMRGCGGVKVFTNQGLTAGVVHGAGHGARHGAG